MRILKLKEKNKSRTIKIDYLARVEGEGALYIKIKENKVQDVKLKIFEPPRFFEAFLKGRSFKEAPDITARICGICPVAYEMSTIHAIENALGVKINNSIRELRRLIYCGEWIESHTLHIYMLHAPDFLGYESGIHMAKDHPKIVERGLRIKKTGNEIISLIGGREIHPINIKIGGFYKTPTKNELCTLTDKIKKARDEAVETVKWASSLKIPDFEKDYEFVSLSHPNEYPINEGKIISNKGLNIEVKDFDNYFEEEHVKYTNALHCKLKQRGSYFVGPMARYNLNFNKLSKITKETAKEAGMGPACLNPFKSIIIRSLEVLYAFDEALRIIENYEPPEHSNIEANSKDSTGYACTEAPRGALYHRYSISKDGSITDAKIIPPTSQNQRIIEEDLYNFIPKHINLSDEKLRWHCEQAVRNYDPCISCATHFLKLEVDRT